jgi:hypothetical protein
MRVLAFCCVLLLVGCDTLGGRAVVLKLQPAAGESDVQLVLKVVDRTMTPEGARRVTATSSEQQHIAHYVGGHFICTVGRIGDELIVDFRNPSFGAGGRLTPTVKRVSAAVAENLKSQYGDRSVRFE